LARARALGSRPLIGSSRTYRSRAKEAGGKPQLLGHTLRIGADRLVECGDVQVERSEHRTNALFLVSASEQLQHHRYEFATGEKIRGGKPLGEERKAGAGPRAAMRGAVDLDRARIEVAESSRHLIKVVFPAPFKPARPTHSPE